MNKRIVCGSAAILITGISAAMFSLAASHTREAAVPSPYEVPAVAADIETVLVVRSRHIEDRATAAVTAPSAKRAS